MVFLLLIMIIFFIEYSLFLICQKFPLQQVQRFPLWLRLYMYTAVLAASSIPVLLVNQFCLRLHLPWTISFWLMIITGGFMLYLTARMMTSNDESGEDENKDDLD